MKHKTYSKTLEEVVSIIASHVYNGDSKTELIQMAFNIKRNNSLDQLAHLFTGATGNIVEKVDPNTGVFYYSKHWK